MSPRAKLVKPFGHAQGRIERDPFRFHLGERLVGDFIDKGAMLDRVGSDFGGIGDVSGIAGVDGNRKILRLGFARHRASTFRSIRLKG